MHFYFSLNVISLKIYVRKLAATSVFKKYLLSTEDMWRRTSISELALEKAKQVGLETMTN